MLISSVETAVAGYAFDASSIDSPSKNLSALMIECDNNTTTWSKPLTHPSASSCSTPTQVQHLSPPSSPLLAGGTDKTAISESITIKNVNDTDQSAAAAIAQAKAGGASASPTPGVSVLGIEETASLISGERWDLTRTPTPTFRQATPPVPHRPPTPPDQIPSIYLEGPIPSNRQEIVVRESQIEVEGGDDYDYDDDYEPNGPVILSGKVTLSVISSAAGASHEDLTEAPSLSLEDRAQAPGGSNNRNASVRGGNK